MFNKLKSPYAIEVNWKKDLLKMSLIALGIPMFFLVFQPFGIFQEVDLNNTATIAAIFGFGIICGIVTLVFWIVLPTLFNHFFDNFLLWQAICFFLVFLLVLASVTYFYVYALQEHYDFIWKDYLIILLRTFLIALIPSTIMFFYGYNNRLKSHLRESNTLNKKLQEQRLKEEEEEVTITSENNIQLLKLTSETFLYAESADNYCLIHFLQNDKPKREIFRIALKRVETELKPLLRIVRCHRSYIINTAVITKVEGNSRGLQLSLKHVKQTIPVSRNYISKLRSLINIK